MKPDLSRITFVKEEKGGYSKKYRVKDGKGRTWVAKLGKEAQSETAAVRLVWAVGYVTEINYLVPRLTIEGKGTFENVRLEARPDNVDRFGEWTWTENPFAGKRELQGLKVLMALMENWDLKDSNNRVLVVRRGNATELHYIVSDLGTTFGKTGGQKSPIAFVKSIKAVVTNLMTSPKINSSTKCKAILFVWITMARTRISCAISRLQMRAGSVACLRG